MSTITTPSWEAMYWELKSSFHTMQHLYCKELQRQQEANRSKNRTLRGLRIGRSVMRLAFKIVNEPNACLVRQLDYALDRANKAEAEVKRLEAAMDRAASG